MENAQEKPQPDTSHKANRFVSKGWRVHNELTYRAVNWILNSTLGVSFAYWTEAAESGRKWFSEPFTGIYKKGLSFINKNEGFVKGGSVWMSRFTGIMVGGFSIIPLVMVMENTKNKKRIVRWLDEKIYGKECVDNDPKFEQSYHDIDKEPKKKFGVGMVTRFLALAPLLLPVFIPTTRKWLDKNIFNTMARGTQWAAEKIHIKPAKMSSELLPGDGEGRTKWQFLHYLVAFDFGLTFVYSFLHEAAYKALSAVGIKQVKEVGPPKQPALVPAKVADEPELADKAAPKYARKKAASYAQQIASSRGDRAAVASV